MYNFPILQQLTKKFKHIHSSSVFCGNQEPLVRYTGQKNNNKSPLTQNQGARGVFSPNISVNDRQGTMQTLMVWKEIQVSPPERRSTCSQCSVCEKKPAVWNSGDSWQMIRGIIWSYPPGRMPVTTNILPFLVGNPQLNLPLWLASWVGDRPKVFHGLQNKLVPTLAVLTEDEMFKASTNF